MPLPAPLSRRRLFPFTPAPFTPAPITLADLPPALRERFIGRSGAWLLQVFCKDSLWEFGPLEHFAQQIQTVDPEATGKPFGTVEGLKAMKHGFEKAGAFALAAIVLILWHDFRDPRHVSHIGAVPADHIQRLAHDFHAVATERPETRFEADDTAPRGGDPD